MRVEAVHDNTEEVADNQKETEAKYGIRLVHNQRYYELHTRTKELQEKWISCLAKFCVMTCYSSAFENIKIIGEGSFAKVSFLFYFESFTSTLASFSL